MAARIEAQEKADELAAVLGLDRWRPRVWENCGWHWAAVSLDDRIEVHPTTAIAGMTSGFLAFLRRPGSGGGGRWSAGVEGDDPRLAVGAVLAKAREELEEIREIVEGASS